MRIEASRVILMLFASRITLGRFPLINLALVSSIFAVLLADRKDGGH